MLWKVHIRLRQKIALTALFGLILITVAISIIRVAVVMSRSPQPEQSWLFLWTTIENTVGMTKFFCPLVMPKIQN